MKMTKFSPIHKNILILICVIIFFTWAIYTRLEQSSDLDELKLSHSFTVGVIERIAPKSRSSGRYYCSYYFINDGDTVRSYVVRYLNESRTKYLENLRFPVAYEKGDVRNNEMLIFKEDFDNYKLKYPDSLKVLYDILEKHE